MILELSALLIESGSSSITTGIRTEVFALTVRYTIEKYIHGKDK
jgi:hypothetical protein